MMHHQIHVACRVHNI